MRAMLNEPALAGEVPVGGMLDVLREVEKRRITGRLRFISENEQRQKETGEVELIGGQIALDQEPLPDGSDPVERLLALRRGHYAVHQRLPNLPVSKGDEHKRTGSLRVHVAADLMNYCEQSGLTGTLVLVHGPDKVEIVYEYGELLAIRVDGEPHDDLSHVFGWDDGRFVIEVNAAARARVPSVEVSVDEEGLPLEPTGQFVRPRLNETGEHFLHVFEVALTDIVAKREKARPSSRPRPASELAQSVRPRMPAMHEPPPRKREPTVRVVYLKADDPSTAVVPSDVRTRHVGGGLERDTAREDVLPDAKPERRPSQEMDRVEPLPARTRERAEVRSQETDKLERPRALAPIHATIQPLEGPWALAWIVLVLGVGAVALVLLHGLAQP
jgi:hypothetical protein